MSDEVLFKSAADALRFAFNYSHQQYDRPLMNRLATKSSGEGKGLVGQDGAGQAGMIRSRLEKLPHLYRVVLAARYAPHSFPCTCGRPCCAGTVFNLEWREAVGAVASYACEIVPGGVAQYRLRRGLLFRHFGPRTLMSDIAKKSGVNVDTATAHNRALMEWLLGPKDDPARGIETIAIVCAHDALASYGIIGSHE